MVFDAESIRIGMIREEDPYGGHRADITAFLGKARMHVQIDIGIGDDIYPEPEMIEYPVLLDHPAPRLRAYRPETAIAEKFHIMVTRGLANSRMKDYFDISELAKRESFRRDDLATALVRTFERRNTVLPEDLPMGLSKEFFEDPEKKIQWRAFLKKNKLDDERRTLTTAVKIVAELLGPLLRHGQDAEKEPYSWPPGGPWQ